MLTQAGLGPGPLEDSVRLRGHSVCLLTGTLALGREKSISASQKGESHSCGRGADMIQTTDFFLNFKNFISGSASLNKATGVFYYFSNQQHYDYFSFNCSIWCLPATRCFICILPSFKPGNCVRQVHSPLPFYRQRTMPREVKPVSPARGHKWQEDSAGILAQPVRFQSLPFNHAHPPYLGPDVCSGSRYRENTPSVYLHHPNNLCSSTSE